MRLAGLVLLLALAVQPASAKDLEIFFVDVEGGQATLIVTPDGTSLLIDAGYGRGSRDPDRIMAAASAAGIRQIDYLMVTHFHGDHVGGIPELAARIPIGTFLDYGAPLGTIFGQDRMSVRGFATYSMTRNDAGHHVPRAGERLPIGDAEAVFVTSGGTLIPSPLPGGGQETEHCASLEDHPEDGTENFRSLGLVLRYGRFSFADVGDVSGNTLSKLVCPRNLVGEVSAYLIAHHGNYDANSAAMYAALKPRVAILNNGPDKGSDPETVKTVRSQPGTELWQLHESIGARALNAPAEFIANLDGVDDAAHWLRLSAAADGSFTVTNGRTGVTRYYPAERPVSEESRAQ